MKICNKCKIEKPLNEFFKDSSKKDNVTTFCKICKTLRIREYQKVNSDFVKEFQKKYRRDNKYKRRLKQIEYLKNNSEKRKISCRAYYNKNIATIKQKKNINSKKNKQKIYNYQKEYNKKNRDKCNYLGAKYRSRKLQRTPKWLTLEHKNQIKWFYVEALRLQNIDGIKRQVDHIIPLKGENVCGLHVPWNLQILTAEENSTKRNKLLTEHAKPDTINIETNKL